MPVTTTAAAIHITPIVLKTFFEHYKRKGEKLAGWSQDNVATDNILYDEGFNIVKSFLEMACQNTIESLQAFTNTHIPSPPSTAVCPVRIPFASCNDAADILIKWFGDEDLKKVVGGERWWQVRGLDGIDGEWITQKQFLREVNVDASQKLSATDTDIRKMDHIYPVMLYVHGGGYFFGSINTHRYQIIRYARKIRGRAFAVNYRKAPQYPWPCPVHDVLAAYRYLTHPPPDALHSAVPPEKIVLAGDSAGGGLCLTLLTILRDMGIPLPAGAVLISPWVDLTHSFPSVMENVKTDIIPSHGFMAKPSAIWPIDSLPPDGRVVPTTSNPPPEPGHAENLKKRSPLRKRTVSGVGKLKDILVCSAKPIDEGHAPVMNQAEMLRQADESKADDQAVDDNGGHGDDKAGDVEGQPKPAKVLMKDPNEKPLELRSQIQLYATNEQITHPLVSPIVQGSLGNLCPLYIIAGDGEALRDEVIYMAHRAAYPSEFPCREGVLEAGRRQKENAAKFTRPTPVHLEVYDGMCHVLTVFTFTESANHAYRGIAQFVRHVTSHPSEHLVANPFPEFHYLPPRPLASRKGTSSQSHRRQNSEPASPRKASDTARPRSSSESSSSDSFSYDNEGGIALREVKTPPADESSRLGIQSKDITPAEMKRERVDIYGKVRPMESKEDMKILSIPPSEIGLIKEAPVRRWLAGQEEWDAKFKTTALRVQRQRHSTEVKVAKLLDNAREKGLLLVDEVRQPNALPRAGSHDSLESVHSTAGVIQEDRRWGPLDLTEEDVPSSAICNRRDTLESFALLKKSIYHSAPITHKAIPRVTKIDVIRAALDPHDRVGRPPQQSASEEQQSDTLNPVHGLSMWDGILSYFIKRSSEVTANSPIREEL